MLEREVERLTARVQELELENARVEGFAAVAAHELVEPLVMTEAYASILTDRLHEPEHAAPGSGSAGRPRPQARATSSRARGPLSRRMSASGSSTASSVARTSGAPRAPASG
jgi:hypothetical protein